MPDISENGVYIDSKTGEVVESPPEEGVQLVAPGGEITPDIARDIKAARDAAAGRPAPVATIGAPAEEPAEDAKASKKK